MTPAELATAVAKHNGRDDDQVLGDDEMPHLRFDVGVVAVPLPGIRVVEPGEDHNTALVLIDAHFYTADGVKITPFPITLPVEFFQVLDTRGTRS